MSIALIHCVLLTALAHINSKNPLTEFYFLSFLLSKKMTLYARIENVNLFTYSYLNTPVDQ